MTPKERAVRYRRLALAEPDKAKAAILNQIADEAERSTLHGGQNGLACIAHTGNQLICLESAYPAASANR